MTTPLLDVRFEFRKLAIQPTNELLEDGTILPLTADDIRIANKLNEEGFFFVLGRATLWPHKKEMSYRSPMGKSVNTLTTWVYKALMGSLGEVLKEIELSETNEPAPWSPEYQLRRPADQRTGWMSLYHKGEEKV